MQINTTPQAVLNRAK